MPEDVASAKTAGPSRLPRILGVVAAIAAVAVIAGLLIGTEAPARTHAWPMLGHGPQWSYRSPYTGPEAPVVDWVISLPHTTSLPLIGADGHIYFSEEENGTLSIRSLNLDGSTRSTMTVADDGAYSSGGLAFLAPGPTVAFYVFVNRQNGTTLMALDAAYEEAWRTHYEFGVYWWATRRDPDGTVYVVHARDKYDESVWLEVLRDDGTQKWALALTGLASFVAIDSHGTTYVYRDDGRVYAYDGGGRLSWRSDVLPGLPGSYAGCWLAVAPDDTLYVLAFPGDSRDYLTVFALKPSGDMRWHLRIEEVAGGWGTYIPAVAVGPDGGLYFASEEGIHRIDRDGQLARFATIAGRIMIDSAGNVYVGGEGHLYAFSSDGSLKWELPIALDPIHLAMGIDGTIYVGGEDPAGEAKLYAIP